MGEPDWKMSQILRRAMGLLLYSFDFPQYYDYESGFYRNELEVCSTITSSVCVRLMLTREQLANGSITGYPPCVSETS
jgi:hypothetical protein